MTPPTQRIDITALRDWLKLRDPSPCPHPKELDRHVEPNFERRLIHLVSRDGDSIPAYLLVPHGLSEPAAAVLVHHQHNGERHLGKSETVGLAGDAFQAFGPALANRGVIVLATDSICFEDRRSNAKGTMPHSDDWLQHYNEMSYRLVSGDTLMRKVLEDAETSLSLLLSLDEVDPLRVGVLGHSCGGNTALFQAALDRRVRYACASGAVCSYGDKMRRGTGIEMAEVLPNALAHFEVLDLLRLVAPRRFLIASATDDPYSQDADELAINARQAFADDGVPDALHHLRYEGGHALDRERFEAIVAWMLDAGRRAAT